MKILRYQIYKIRGLSSYFINGFDTLYLEGSISNYGVIDKATGKIITWTEYVSLNKNDEGYANKEFYIYKQNTNQAITVRNIEQIVFSDETVGEKEDTVTVYNYDISVNAKLTDIDGSEKLSNATLQNVPEGSKVYGSDGIEIIADENGVYSIKLDENGESKLTLTNEKELSDTELNSIKTSVTSTDTPTDGKEESSQATTFEGEADIDLTSYQKSKLIVLFHLLQFPLYRYHLHLLHNLL